MENLQTKKNKGGRPKVVKPLPERKKEMKQRIFELIESFEMNRKENPFSDTSEFLHIERVLSCKKNILLELSQEYTKEIKRRREEVENIEAREKEKLEARQVESYYSRNKNFRGWDK